MKFNFPAPFSYVMPGVNDYDIFKELPGNLGYDMNWTFYVVFWNLVPPIIMLILSIVPAFKAFLDLIIRGNIFVSL